MRSPHADADGDEQEDGEAQDPGPCGAGQGFEDLGGFDTEDGTGADQERHPERNGQEQPGGEHEEPHPEDAGRDVGDHPRARGEPAQEDDRRPAALEPAAAPLDGGRLDDPLERRVAQRRAAQEPAAEVDPEVAEEDARHHGQRGRQEGNAAAGHEEPRPDAGQVFTGHGGTGQEKQHDQERESLRPGHRARVERPGCFADALRIGRRASDGRSIVYTGHEFPDGTRHHLRLHEGHEVIAPDHGELGLRHDAMVFARRGRRYQHVFVAVNDQHRFLQLLEEPAQGTLVGVVEVARVRRVQPYPVEPPEVWSTLLHQADDAELQCVHGAVQGVVAQELEFLDTNRRQQRERANPAGREAAQLESNPASHAEPDDVDLAHAERVEELEHIAGVGKNRVVRNPEIRSAESWKVGRKDSVLVVEKFREPAYRAAVARTAVQQQDRWLRPGTRRARERRGRPSGSDRSGFARHRRC